MVSGSKRAGYGVVIGMGSNRGFDAVNEPRKRSIVYVYSD